VGRARVRSALTRRLQLAGPSRRTRPPAVGRTYVRGCERGNEVGQLYRAVKLFETLEARFPYGRYAQQAILEGAYSSYRAGETPAATAACDRFIRTYPKHPNVDYAYYLKGLVHFREDQGLLGYVYETDLSERDPKSMKESFQRLQGARAEVPDGRYAEDARARMRYLSNALGMYEVHVARYYFNRGAYVAAVNRGRRRCQLPRTPSNEAALDILVRATRSSACRSSPTTAGASCRPRFPRAPTSPQRRRKPWWKLW